MGILKGPVVRGWAVGTDPRVGLIPEALPPLLPCSPPPTRPVVSLSHGASQVWAQGPAPKILPIIWDGKITLK